MIYDNLYIKTVCAQRGYMPTTYAVFNNKELLYIFLTKQEARQYIERLKTGAAGSENTAAPGI